MYLARLGHLKVFRVIVSFLQQGIFLFTRSRQEYV